MYKPKIKDQILHIIHRTWPIHASGICKELSMSTTINNIAKVSYHLKLLEKDNKIHLKKIDRALVAWPREMEKLRIIHEMLQD